MNVEHVSLDAGTLLVANGKGGKSRLLYLTRTCLDALRAWMVFRKDMGCKHQWLWAYDPARRIGEIGFRQLLEQVKSIAGMSHHSNIKPHSLRHAFAQRLMDNGATIKACQAALGHSDPMTTFKYLHMAEQPAKAMQELAEMGNKGAGKDRESSRAADTRQRSNVSRRQRPI